MWKFHESHNRYFYVLWLSRPIPCEINNKLKTTKSQRRGLQKFSFFPLSFRSCCCCCLLARSSRGLFKIFSTVLSLDYTIRTDLLAFVFDMRWWNVVLHGYPCLDVSLSLSHSLCVCVYCQWNKSLVCAARILWRYRSMRCVHMFCLCFRYIRCSCHQIAQFFRSFYIFVSIKQ